MLYCTGLYRTVLCFTVQYVLYRTVAILYGVVQCSTLQNSTVQHKTAQYKTLLYTQFAVKYTKMLNIRERTLHCCTVHTTLLYRHCSTALECNVQFSVPNWCTVQRTVQCTTLPYCTLYTSVYYTAVQCTALLYCSTTVYCSAVQCTTHRDVEHCTALCTTLLFSVHCSTV